MVTITPKLSSIVKIGFLGNQAVYAVNVTYPGENPRRVTFSGTTTGNGPVVMIQGDSQTIVTDPGRFGEFGPEWVRRFFA